jgi:hypothetical protein
MLVQSAALQVESLALLAWARRTFPSALLGCSGISWGGSMAACVGLLFDGPIAIAPLLGSTSHEVLTDGALRFDIDWEALGSGTAGDAKAREATAKAQLAAAFENFSMARLVGDIKQAVADGQPRALRAAAARKIVRSAAAAHDGFVRLSDSKELHAHCRALVADAQLQTVPGGHASGHVLARWLLTHVVAESVDRLGELPGAEGEAAARRSRL